MTQNRARKHAVRQAATAAGVPYTAAQRAHTPPSDLVDTALAIIGAAEADWFHLQLAAGPEHDLPYPFVVQPDGSIDGQDFWKGEPERLLGFQTGDEQAITMWWRQARIYPDRAIGLRPVFIDRDGTMWAHTRDVVRGGEDDACAHPVAGWRWYPGGEFEPMLYAACKRHCTCDGLLIAQALGLAGNDE